MTKPVFLALVAALSLTATASSAVVIGGIDFPDGATSFADSVVSYTPGTGFTGTTGDCQNASLALGTPDYSSGDCDGYVSLGRAGTLILRFTDNSLTTSGDATPDLHIFEIGSAVEDFEVAISSNGTDWIDLGIFDGQPASIDIDGVAGVVGGTLYSFVRLIDDPNEGPHDGVYAGPDIDAVGAISSGAGVPTVPLPAGGLLLAGSLGALAAWRRKG